MRYQSRVRSLGALALLALMAVGSSAEQTVQLKNGLTYSGDIVSQSDDYVILRVDGNDITIARSMIVEGTIPPASPDEPAEPVAPQESVEPPLSAPSPVAPDDEPAPAVERHRAPAPAPALARAEPPLRRVSFGLQLTYSHTTTADEDYKTKVSEKVNANSFKLMPFVGVRVSKVFEIQPAIGFSITSGDATSSDQGYPDTSSSGSGEAALRYGNLFADLGFHFYVVSDGPLRFSLGPSLYYGQMFEPTTTVNGRELSKFDTYINVDAGLAVPVRLDLVLKNRLGIRLRGDFLRIGASFDYLKDDSIDMDESTVDFKFEVLTLWNQLSAGIFLLF